jgi:hypothetical protein
MNALRKLPDDVVALEKRRAELAGAISGLKRGSSARRTLEAKQAELARSLLRLEIGLPAASAVAEPELAPEAAPEEPTRRPYYWEDRD